MENEIWKDVKGYEGHYQISSLGNIKSLDREVEFRNSKMKLRGKILITNISPSGYPQITLWKNKKAKTYHLHRLCAIAFLGEKLFPEYEVNHKNGIKTDGRLENLEWVTKSQNQIHAYKTGLSKGVNGEAHGLTTLKKEDVLFIRANHSNYRTKDLATKFNVSGTCIRNIIIKKRWVYI